MTLRFGPTTNLAVQDTAQIAAEAATSVATATLATYNIPSGTNNPITTTLPTSSQDCIVLVQAFYNGYWSSGLGLSVDITCANVQSGPTSGGAVDLAHTPGAVSPGIPFAVQWEFPCAAGVAAVVKLRTIATGGGSGQINNITVVHQVVKK